MIIAESLAEVPSWNFILTPANNDVVDRRKQFVTVA